MRAAPFLPSGVEGRGGSHGERNRGCLPVLPERSRGTGRLARLIEIEAGRPVLPERSRGTSAGSGPSTSLGATGGSVEVAPPLPSGRTVARRKWPLDFARGERWLAGSGPSTSLGANGGSQEVAPRLRSGRTVARRKRPLDFAR